MKTIYEIILEDDNTPHGGTSHSNETLAEFIETSGLLVDIDTVDTVTETLNATTINAINNALKECGILPIDEEELDAALRNTKLLKNAESFTTSKGFNADVDESFIGLLDLHWLMINLYTQLIGIGDGSHYVQESDDYIDIIQSNTRKTILCDGEEAKFIFTKDEDGRAWFVAQVPEEDEEGKAYIHQVKFTPEQFFLSVVEDSLREANKEEG